MITLILLAQLTVAHPRHRAVAAEPTVEVDAAVADAEPFRGRESTAIRNGLSTLPLDSEEAPVRVQRTARPAEHAPWYAYALLAAVVLVVTVELARGAVTLKKAVSKKPHIKLQDDKKDEGHYDKVIAPPKTAQQYTSYVSAPTDKIVPTRMLPDGVPPRTEQQCNELYLEGVESLVQRLVWPEKLRTLYVPSEPIETRWRAWLGDSWDKEFVMRATGKGKGQALKSLLRKYRENGSEWISHAIERSRAASIPTPSVPPTQVQS